MGNLYSHEEREEALKLADEIGTAAARRPGINVDTLYGWRGRRKSSNAREVLLYSDIPSSLAGVCDVPCVAGKRTGLLLLSPAIRSCGTGSPAVGTDPSVSAREAGKCQLWCPADYLVAPAPPWLYWRQPAYLQNMQRKQSDHLYKRDFSASKHNEKMLTDITEIACADGKLYLAAVLDCFDGSIQGFQMADHMRAELCVGAFENACKKSGANGAIQSMSCTGHCYDNARMESFFATLKKEKHYPIDTRTLTREEVQSVIFRYISCYNLRRITSVNDGLPPLVYRQRYLEQAKAQAA